MFQTVRERKSDRCDGAEADRTVLRCDAIPRTQSVQVDARFHSIFLKQWTLIHLLVWLCILSFFNRGKLISTILDWEDALPDRDLNKADEASRWDGLKTLSFLVFFILFLVCTQHPVHHSLLQCFPFSSCATNVSIQSISHKKLLLCVDITATWTWMQVTHKRCITVISITKGRRTAVTAELGYLFEAGRCHDGGFDLYYSLDFTHRGTTGLRRPWPSIVMHGFLLFSFFHWLGHSRTGVASKSLLCRRFSWMRDCWWRITVFTLVSFITRGIGEQIVWSGDGFAWCVLLKSSR